MHENFAKFWESAHHLNDLAGIGSFFLTLGLFVLTFGLLYLAFSPPRTPVQTRDNGVAQSIGRLSIRRLRRPAMLTLAFVFGLLTIVWTVCSGVSRRFSVRVVLASSYLL
jgi:hypothetical protein